MSVVVNKLLARRCRSATTELIRPVLFCRRWHPDSLLFLSACAKFHCYWRDERATVAQILSRKQPSQKNIECLFSYRSVNRTEACFSSMAAYLRTLMSLDVTERFSDGFEWISFQIKCTDRRLIANPHTNDWLSHLILSRLLRKQEVLLVRHA